MYRVGDRKLIVYNAKDASSKSMIEIVPYDPGWARDLWPRRPASARQWAALPCESIMWVPHRYLALPQSRSLTFKSQSHRLGHWAYMQIRLPNSGTAAFPDPGDSISSILPKASHVAQHVPHPFVRPWLGARKPAYCFSLTICAAIRQSQPSMSKSSGAWPQHMTVQLLNLAGRYSLSKTEFVNSVLEQALSAGFHLRGEAPRRLATTSKSEVAL